MKSSRWFDAVRQIITKVYGIDKFKITYETNDGVMEIRAVIGELFISDDDVIDSVYASIFIDVADSDDMAKVEELFVAAKCNRESFKTQRLKVEEGRLFRHNTEVLFDYIDRYVDGNARNYFRLLKTVCTLQDEFRSRVRLCLEMAFDHFRWSEIEVDNLFSKEGTYRVTAIASNKAGQIYAIVDWGVPFDVSDNNDSLVAYLKENGKFTKWH